MSSRICPIVINCECIEIPYANLSAENAEPYVFVSPHIIIRNPPLARTFTQLGCKRWCYSSISQADADECAKRQAMECATVERPQPPIFTDPPIPPISFPVVNVMATEPVTSFGGEPGVFTLSRNGSIAQPLTVQFTLSGSAENGVDYDMLPYAVTINAGDSSVDVIVVPMDTGEIVSKEVILTVLSGSNYSPGSSPSAIVDIVVEYEVVWNDPPRARTPPLDNTDESCPWPHDYYTSTPFGCEMCRPDDDDPYRWPLGGEGLPNDENTTVTQFDHHVYASLYDHERIYLRQPINGGATGKHVKLTAQWTFPGGEKTTEVFNSDTGQFETHHFTSNFELGMNQNPCAVFAFDAHPQLVIAQAESANGTLVYEFDIPAGVDAYACVQANSSTNGFGPCTIDLLTEITSF